MFSLFIVLLSFSESLAKKCLLLNDEPFMIRSTIIDLNPVDLRYYPFMNSLNKCTGNSNVCYSKNVCSKRNKRQRP